MFNVSFGGTVAGHAWNKQIGNSNTRELAEALKRGMKEGADALGLDKVYLNGGLKMTGAQLERSNPGLFDAKTKLILNEAKPRMEHFLDKMYKLNLKSNLKELSDAAKNTTIRATENFGGKNIVTVGLNVLG